MLDEISRSESELNSYEQEKKSQLDRQTAMLAYVERKGEEKGRTEGKVEVAKKMLAQGIDIQTIILCTGNIKVIMNPKTPPPLSSLAKLIAVGTLYEHYKGLRYKVLAVARHSETLEEFVVYQAFYGEGGVWVRPLAMFLENVTVNGQSQPRFKVVQ